MIEIILKQRIGNHQFVSQMEFEELDPNCPIGKIVPMGIAELRNIEWKTFIREQADKQL